jgi:AcrR family transcriptional regulator
MSHSMTATTPRLSKAQRTREAVLAAAEDLFSERGFEATSLRAIGERAGIQGTAILYHHRSKRELYEAVLDRMFAPLFDEVHRQLDTDASLPDRLGSIAVTMVRFAAQRPAAARLVLRESVSHGEALDIVGAASQRQWARFVDALAGERGVDFDPLVVWNVVVGAICFYFAAGPTVGGFTYDPLDPERVAAFEVQILRVTRMLCGAAQP